MRCLALDTLPQAALAAVLRQTDPLHRLESHPLQRLRPAKSCPFWEQRTPNALASNQGVLTLLAIPQPLAPCSQARTPQVPLRDRQRNAISTLPHCPPPKRQQGSGRAAKQSMQPLGRRALGGRPTPFLPWRFPQVPAARSVPW